jgi:hypothetical protein
MLAFSCLEWSVLIKTDFSDEWPVRRSGLWEMCWGGDEWLERVACEREWRRVMWEWVSGGDERANSWCIMNDEQSEYALHLNAAGGAGWVLSKLLQGVWGSPQVEAQDLKETVPWDFRLQIFFHESISPKPLSIPLGPFKFCSTMRRYIFAVQGAPPESLTPVAFFGTPLDSGVSHIDKWFFHFHFKV